MIYLNVPYSDREDAKRLGGRFDGVSKKWYAPTGKEAELIATYGDAQAQEEARLAVVALARRMMPRQRTVSEGFKQGHYMYPGYAFRDASAADDDAAE
jgi:hypothetical protein